MTELVNETIPNNPVEFENYVRNIIRDELAKHKETQPTTSKNTQKSELFTEIFNSRHLDGGDTPSDQKIPYGEKPKDVKLNSDLLKGYVLFQINGDRSDFDHYYTLHPSLLEKDMKRKLCVEDMYKIMTTLDFDTRDLRIEAYFEDGTIVHVLTLIAGLES